MFLFFSLKNLRIFSHSTGSSSVSFNSSVRFRLIELGLKFLIISIKKKTKKRKCQKRVYLIKISSGRNGLNETPILSNTTIVSFLFIYHFWVLFFLFFCLCSLSLSICALPCCLNAENVIHMFSLLARYGHNKNIFYVFFLFLFFLAWGKSTGIHTHSLAFSLSPDR